MTEVNEVWIAIQKISQTKNQILCAWCLCVAGANETAIILLLVCNIDSANLKCFFNLSCTEQGWAWLICDLFVRKILASSKNKNIDKIPHEEARMKDLSAFGPIIESHWHKN